MDIPKDSLKREYNLIVDELLSALKQRGFSREEVESQLAKLVELSILRIAKELLEQASIPQHSLTLAELEKVLFDCAKKKPQSGARLDQEFKVQLRDYLTAVCS
jgi:parvulin-like peptidyl-prolyl isomerase